MKQWSGLSNATAHTNPGRSRPAQPPTKVTETILELQLALCCQRLREPSQTESPECASCDWLAAAPQVWRAEIDALLESLWTEFIGVACKKEEEESAEDDLLTGLDAKRKRKE